MAADQRGLRFGTAGVRAPLGDGPDRLNDATVARLAAGIASWLPPGASVVVGHDARERSAEFAVLTAGELRSRGGARRRGRPGADARTRLHHPPR